MSSFVPEIACMESSRCENGGGGGGSGDGGGGGFGWGGWGEGGGEGGGFAQQQLILRDGGRQHRRISATDRPRARAEQ